MNRAEERRISMIWNPNGKETNILAYAMDTGRYRTRRCRDNTGEGRRAYGALNAVGGLNGYGRYISTSSLRSCPCQGVTDPIYRGPCPPNPDGTDLENVYADFYQQGEWSADADSPVAVTDAGVEFRRLELNSTNIISEEGIAKERTRILIYDPGIYVMQYEVNVPEDQLIDTVFALLYNREIIPGSAVSLVKSVDGSSAHASAHAIIEVDGNGAELILGSTGLFTITPDAYTSAASLSIFSIA